MKKTLCGVLAAASVVALTGAAVAQTTYQYQYETPTVQGQSYGGTTYGTGTTVYGGTGTSTYTQQGATTYTPPSGTTTFTQPGVTYGGTTTYPQPGVSYGGTTGTTVYPQPQPYIPGQPTTSYPLPAPPPPVNPNPLPRRGEVPDTDAWTFNLPRYYPAIQACLRNTSVENPVIANIQERQNATVMLIGQGGTSEYSVCRTGLKGTRVRPGKNERGLPPAFYAPLGSAFTITPDRPFQPVVDTSQRLLGWVVRTTPVRLDLYGGRGFDGQFIRPVTVNPDAR